MATDNTGAPKIKLTPAQQDYLEACYLLDRRFREQATGDQDATGDQEIQPVDTEPVVRITDIAHELGTKLPTVTRSMARLKKMGLIEQQEARGPVRLSEQGQAIARQLIHRHRDVMYLLTSVLGIEPRRAKDEACLLEHGLSGASAQRLHEFLLRWDRLPDEVRHELRGEHESRHTREFSLVGRASGAGRRR